jgi:hypothetical protein
MEVAHEAAVHETVRGRLGREALDDLVEDIARQCGAWLIVEQGGRVLSHAPGCGPCPEAAAEALLHRTITPLRRALRWSKQEPRSGTIDGQRVDVVQLSPVFSAWLIGGSSTPHLERLVHVLPEDVPPQHDGYVANLLEPGRHPGAVPLAQLLVVEAVEIPRTAARLASALSGTGTRVHCMGDHVVVALGEDVTASRALLAAGPGTVTASGAARVVEGAADWSVAYRHAARACRMARAGGYQLADAGTPDIAAQLIVEAAATAAVTAATEVDFTQITLLRQYDADNGTHLLGTVEAWCRHGMDTVTAAAALHVHPNTLRYRLRRASEIGGIDLMAPHQLLALQILTACARDRPRALRTAGAAPGSC